MFRTDYLTPTPIKEIWDSKAIYTHGPKPMYYQFQAEHIVGLTWNYMDQHLEVWSVVIGQPNGLRYPRVGGTRQYHFTGTNFQSRKLPENAVPPTRRVHAVLGSSGA